MSDYNNEREHQSLGDQPPVRRFELAKPASLEVIDGDIAIEEEPPPRPQMVSRRVDRAGRISILKHRYHVGRHLTGEAVTIESTDGLLHVSHNDVVVATHARRHLLDDDDKMDRRSKAAKPVAPTKGGEVLRGVDRSGSVSFAGTTYRVGNRFIGQTAGVCLVGDTVQITIDGALVRTHRARHDRSKEFGALAQPNGKPRRNCDGVAWLPEPIWDTGGLTFTSSALSAVVTHDAEPYSLYTTLTRFLTDELACPFCLRNFAFSTHRPRL